MTTILQEDSIRLPKPGDIVIGKVIAKESSNLFLDLGALGTGIIYGREFYIAKNEIKQLNVGDIVSARIIELENDEGYVELSLKEASEILSWEDLLRKKEVNELFKVKVLGANKGGLLTKIGDIPGFLPVSQLSPFHYPKVADGDPIKILRELQKFIGKEIEVEILDIDQREKKLILSEKAKESRKIKNALKNYKVGDIVEGEISGLTNFGAFLKFPFSPQQKESAETLEGLIHISELDWQTINNPSEIVQIGEKVSAKIIEIVDDKIYLSLKATKDDPWKDIETKFKKGEVVSGRVTKLNPFGAFIQILDEKSQDTKIQGLCHISEFGSQKAMAGSLKTGQTYHFKIMLLDSANHRMILKLIS